MFSFTKKISHLTLPYHITIPFYIYTPIDYHIRKYKELGVRYKYRIREYMYGWVARRGRCTFDRVVLMAWRACLVQRGARPVAGRRAKGELYMADPDSSWRWMRTWKMRQPRLPRRPLHPGLPTLVIQNRLYHL